MSSANPEGVYFRVSRERQARSDIPVTECRAVPDQSDRFMKMCRATDFKIKLNGHIKIFLRVLMYYYFI